MTNLTNIKHKCSYITRDQYFYSRLACWSCTSLRMRFKFWWADYVLSFISWKITICGFHSVCACLCASVCVLLFFFNCCESLISWNVDRDLITHAHAHTYIVWWDTVLQFTVCINFICLQIINPTLIKYARRKNIISCLTIIWPHKANNIWDWLLHSEI